MATTRRCTDVELWAQNRGRYDVKAERIEAERYATPSYRGEIVVVTALTGWEPFEDYERTIMKKALIGNVLGPGDTPYDAMGGRTIPSGRSAGVYLADDEYVVAAFEASQTSVGSTQSGSSFGSRRSTSSKSAQTAQTNPAIRAGDLLGIKTGKHLLDTSSRTLNQRVRGSSP